ncbi:MAG: leucine-rich repeat protein [Clostridia bacterium]|nr:leucine-rich repeat protein [Clostridia bacterium]
MKTKIISYLLSALMLISLLPTGVYADGEAPLSGECGENVSWVFDPKTGELRVSGKGEMHYYYYKPEYNYDDVPDACEAPWKTYAEDIRSVVIEEGVTSVYGYAFCACKNIRTVTLPESLTDISVGAFKNCRSLESIRLPDKLKYIYRDAFIGCDSIVSVEIPDSVTYLGEWAFSYCASLRSAKLSPNIGTIGNSIFSGCGALERVTLPEGFSEISSYMFYNCSSLTSVVIPESVTKVGAYAFCGCSSLIDVVFPKNCTDYSYNIFKDTAWLAAQPDGAVYINNYVYTHKGDGAECVSIVLREGTEGIIASAFSGDTTVESVIMPDSVKFIGAEAFMECRNLKSVKLSSGLSEIRTGTFRQCSSLTSIDIPEGVAKIGAHAFWDCRALVSVKLPDSLTEFEYGAFTCCTELSEITIPKNVRIIGKEAFRTCSKLSFINISDGVEFIGEKAFNDTAWYEAQPGGVIYLLNFVLGYNSGYPSELELREGTKVVADHAFDEAYGLVSVTMPDTVEHIGNYAFNHCERISTLKLSANLKTIGEYAFCLCSDLKELEIPEGVETIGTHTFYKCTGLFTVKLPESLKKIGDYAFYECAAIGRMNLPAGSSEIGTVIIPSGVTEIGEFTFADCRSMKKIVLPDGLKKIGMYAFDKCTALEEINLPEGLTEIADGTFRECKKLSSVTLPEGIRRIGSAAFYYSGLQSVNIPGRVRSLGRMAFYCFGLKELYIPDGIQTIGDPRFPKEYAFPIDSKCVYYCYEGSEAEKYLSGKTAKYTAVPYDIPFSDVSRDAWYMSAAVYCNEKGYMTGTGEDIFDPDTVLTRAMFVQTLARIAGADLDSFEYTDRFTDVVPDDWYAKAVQWAADNGITEGTGDGRFSPDDPLTREQFAVFLLAYSRLSGEDLSDRTLYSIFDYSDSQDVSSWAYEAMRWAVTEGFISGTSLTTLSPKLPATRGQAAVMIRNFTGALCPTGSLPEPDIAR